MLNRISKDCDLHTLLLSQLGNVNPHNYVHVAEYSKEHNIRYAEILRLSKPVDMMI